MEAPLVSRAADSNEIWSVSKSENSFAWNMDIENVQYLNFGKIIDSTSTNHQVKVTSAF